MHGDFLTQPTSPLYAADPPPSHTSLAQGHHPPWHYTLTVCCLINLEGKRHKPGAAAMNLLPWHGMVVASISEVAIPQGTCPDPVQKGRVAWARLAHAGAGTAWFSPVSKPD